MQSTVELTGQTVFKIDGPGQQATDGLAADKGEIIEVTENEYAGTQVWIVWSEGNKEPYTPQTIQPASEQNGLGVYLSEDSEEEEADKDDAIKSDAPEMKDMEARLEELNQVTTTGDIFPCLYSVGIEAQDIHAMRAKTVYDIAGNESTTYFLTFANGEKHLLFVDERTKELTF